MAAAVEARALLPVRGVCRALGLSRATFYRRTAPPPEFPLPKSASLRQPHARRLSDQERSGVLDLLHSERFTDMAPAAVYAMLLDEGAYHCSIRTMYRILKENGEVRERRAQAVHPRRTPPELVATAPNQVWTWDITHLRMTVHGATLKLYVCLDLFSRFAVGWYLSATESAAQARHLFETLARRHGIGAGRLIVHADNGGPMRGQPMADLLESLGIGRSHSRPRTSNDNAFSESQFKTMKYRPTYPGRFDSEDAARAWCREFFQWYNHGHRHEGLALLTPADVHAGRAAEKIEARAAVLAAAFRRTPNRFVRGLPTPGRPPETVAINPTKPPRPEAQTGATQLQEVTKQ